MAAQCEELGLAGAVAGGRGRPRATSSGPGRARAAGRRLMFNGHMDTSYSGREPWLRGIPGFQPQGFVQDGRIYGLGISNMKGALGCYVEAVRALQDAGVRLRGDVLLAASRARSRRRSGARRGREYRGYAAGSRYLVSSRRRRGHVHPRRADRAEGRARRTSARSGCGSRRAGRSSTPRSRRAGPRRTRSSACRTCSPRARVDPRSGRSA